MRFGRKGTKTARDSGRGDSYRIFFATDIHGSDRCFRKFLAAAKVYSADALILGGDIAGKALVPFVEAGGGRYSFHYHGETRAVAGDELEAAQGRVKFSGMYPLLCTSEESQKLSENQEHRTAVFEKVITDQVADWLELAADRLAPEIRCIITPGNDDPFAVDAVLGSTTRVECPEGQVVPLGPIVLASLGNTNRTPWDTDREYDEDELACQINAMLGSRPLQAPLVVNFHCPPYDSGLDTVAKLDETLKPVVSGGAVVEIPVGSTAVRAAIERYAPVVGLHGHIHEADGVTKIGTTMCINPGSMYGSGSLKGAIVDFDASGAYVSHVLTSG